MRNNCLRQNCFKQPIIILCFYMWKPKQNAKLKFGNWMYVAELAANHVPFLPFLGVQLGSISQPPLQWMWSYDRILASETWAEGICSLFRPPSHSSRSAPTLGSCIITAGEQLADQKHQLWIPRVRNNLLSCYAAEILLFIRHGTASVTWPNSEIGMWYL